MQQRLTLLLAFHLLIISTAVYGQCNYVPGTQPRIQTDAGVRSIAWTLTGTPGCTPTSDPSLTVNGASCEGAYVSAPGSFYCPAGTMSCSVLNVRIAITSMGAPTMTGSHTCSWNCGTCGTIVIDNGNGLPVELMEFSVDGDSDDGRETEMPSVPVSRSVPPRQQG